MKKLSSFLVIICLITFVSPLTAEEWKLARDDQDIKVFTKTNSDSDMDEFLGTATFETDLSVIEAVLGDVPAQTEWMQDCIEAKLVKKYPGTTGLFTILLMPPGLWKIEMLS